MFRRQVSGPALAVVAFLQFAESAPTAADAPVTVSGVRANTPAIAALIQQGVARSKTFQSLVAAIEGTDGIVYVAEGKCGHSVHACLALTLTVAGPNRVLRILIEPRGAERRRIASLGHELRHALEALNQPRIRSNGEMFQFFSREGPTGRETFETPAAVRAGLDVYAELGSGK